MTLQELITAELERSDDRDPSVIANRVLMRMDIDAMRDALAETLRTQVRVVMSRSRMEAGRERATPSSKWDRFTRLVGEGVFVNGTWKTMGDCTAEDFDWLADDREQRAAEMVAVAARYRGYALTMRKTMCERFADLGSLMDVAA